MSTVVVFGGGGFLASHIEKHFSDLGWRVVSVGRAAGSTNADVRHVWQLPTPEIGHLFAVEQPDLCVNAAGRASVPASMVEPLADFEGSVHLNFCILDDLRRRSSRSAYVHLSSAAVYGSPITLPIDEACAAVPVSPYGWHKHLSELVVEEHARHFGMRTSSLRIFSAYGANLHRQVVWDLSRRALTSSDGTLLLHGLSDDSRDFVHGADVASAIAAVAARAPLQGEAYNVASGVETPIRELAQLILAEAGLSQEVRFTSRPVPGNPVRWHADIRRLASLGWSPAVGLKTGVAEVLSAARKSRA